MADTKKATIVLEDSADGTTFAAIPGLAALEVAGAGGTGAEAINRRLRLPADVRQYLRANVTVEAAAGDNTAQTAATCMRAGHLLASRVLRHAGPRLSTVQAVANETSVSASITS